MRSKKTIRPRKIFHIVMSLDGRLHDSGGEGRALGAYAAEDLIDEIHLEISPEILGGFQTSTVTGPLSDFLPRPLDFRLTSMQVDSGRCVVKYRRVSGPAC